ncbi:MAG: hypothetical protein ACXAEF_07265 [Candidatus Thorarchaeota archaeon]
MNDISKSKVDNILNSIDEKTRHTEEAFEKLLVALTGMFRLLDGKQSILATLQGTPEEIQAYILKLLGELRISVHDSYTNLKTDIQAVSKELEKR